MAIIVKGTQFHLKTDRTSYIFYAYQSDNDYNNRLLTHLYWGAPLNDDIDLRYGATTDIFSRASAFATPVDPECKYFIPDVPMEFATIGGGDYRNPVMQAEHTNGSTVSEFMYKGYKIIDGKPALEGMPSTYVDSDDEAKTLVITLEDDLAQLRAELYYTVFENYNVITRNIRYTNFGGDEIKLLSAQSMCMDFLSQDYRILHLQGDWACERKPEFVKVHHGKFEIGSKRGMSSHMENPFFALVEGNADEYHGDVYGFSLVYSGSFNAVVEGSSGGMTRVTMGINPFNFCWQLGSGEHLQTPEVVLSYSADGLDGMSQNFHKIYRERLMRKPFRDALRPMIINNWEATGQDFTEQKLVDIAEVGAQTGLEMFVLDDGWFGKDRATDKNGLGDWWVDKTKLPDGLDSLVKKINAMGMKFGLWVEPEMVNPLSTLYQLHPDWCIHADGRMRTLNRNQLVLDLSKDEVVDYLIETFTGVLSSANIEYIKWDCNRNMTETANQMQMHKYVLGLYRLLDTLTSRFPNVLFEGCSGGGGRFDPGMLYYMPQTWTSDMAHPIPRLTIQTGTSFVYPPIAMTGHICSIEVGQDKFNKYMDTCAMVAMATCFGFELDLSKLSEAERKQAAEYVEFYREIRPVVQFGDFHRLENPFDGENVSWQFVSPDKKQSVAFFYQRVRMHNEERRHVKLHGLDPMTKYECNGQVYYGEELMNFGVNVKLGSYQYYAQSMVFTAVE